MKTYCLLVVIALHLAVSPLSLLAEDRAPAAGDTLLPCLDATPELHALANEKLAPARIDAEAVLRQIELNVAIKQFEKVLTARYEAHLDLQLGAAERDMTSEQRKAWDARAMEKYTILDKLVHKLRIEIHNHILEENRAVQAKENLTKRSTPE